MTTYYMPAVTPIAYPAFFKRCNSRLPDTFGEWRLAEDAIRRDLAARGYHVIGVCVAPADFDGYCRSMNCEADTAALGALAAQRGAAIYGDPVRNNAYGARGAVADDIRTVRPGLVEDVSLRRRPWWAFWRRSDGLPRRQPW